MTLVNMDHLVKFTYAQYIICNFFFFYPVQSNPDISDSKELRNSLIYKIWQQINISTTQQCEYCAPTLAVSCTGLLPASTLAAYCLLGVTKPSPLCIETAADSALEPATTYHKRTNCYWSAI